MIYNRTIFIEFHTKYLSPASPIQMTDQYGLTPEFYILDLKILSMKCYGLSMLLLIISFAKQELKPFQVIVASLMLYDLTYHIPQQVSLSIFNN